LFVQVFKEDLFVKLFAIRFDVFFILDFGELEVVSGIFEKRVPKKFFGFLQRAQSLKKVLPY